MTEKTRAASGTATINRTTGLVSKGGQFTEPTRLAPEADVLGQFVPDPVTSLADARTLAIQLMATHNIVSRGWTFDFDKARSRIGQTNYLTRTITMGAAYVQSANTESITQTMLHEIAHVHVGPGHGHDAEWKRAGYRIGHTGGRTGENPAATKRDAVKLAAAQFAAQSVSQVTSGPILPGELVTTLTGKYTGLLVSVARVNATIFCDQTGAQVLIKYSSLYRPRDVKLAAPAAVTAPSARMARGDRLITLSGRTGEITKAGRSRYHFTDDDGQMWSAPMTSCAPVR